MNAKVKVTADELGNVVVVSKNNPNWAHIRVEQKVKVFDETGFGRTKKISALIHGTTEDLKDFGWLNGQELAGRIIFKESLEPFNTREPERDYKVAGKTGIVCCLDGQPIYRKTFYTESANAANVSIAHNNTEDIRAAYASVAEEVEDSNMTDL